MEYLKNYNDYFKQLPEATLLHADQSKYYDGALLITVKCPYCEKKHYHGVNKNERNITRSSDCSKGEYRILTMGA